MTRLLTVLFLFLTFQSLAQSNNEPSDYNPHDIKLTGYLQFQFQKAQENGAPTFEGGDFPSGTDNRFIIRRGRVKLDRVDKYTNIVVQIDATQDGVTLRDALFTLKDPFLKTFSITGGQFTKPFGYILSYSSGVREFPERPRMHQTLFPSERDLGAMLTIQSPKLKFLRYDIGVFNGTGLNARDFDNRKDISTHLGSSFTIGADWETGAGISYYSGFVKQGTAVQYVNSNTGGTRGFAPVGANMLGSYARREYRGVNFEVQKQTDKSTSSLKAEYIRGTQPGVLPGTTVKPAQASRSIATLPSSDIYSRDFEGYFLWLVQTIPSTQLQLIASYDQYDPNRYVSGNQIGVPGSNTSAGDIKFNTFGMGMVYYLTKEIKSVIYYSHPINESTQLDGYRGDQRDDIFTLRVQYRF